MLPALPVVGPGAETWPPQPPAPIPSGPFDLRDVSVVVYPNYVTQDSGLALLQDCAWNSHESGEGTVASLFLNAYRDFEENQVLEAGAGTRDFMAQRLAVIDWNPCIGPNGQWSGTKRYNAAVNIAETFMPQFRAELLARLDEIRDSV